MRTRAVDIVATGEHVRRGVCKDTGRCFIAEAIKEVMKPGYEAYVWPTSNGGDVTFWDYNPFLGRILKIDGAFCRLPAEVGAAACAFDRLDGIFLTKLSDDIARQEKANFARQYDAKPLKFTLHMPVEVIKEELLNED